MSAESEELDRLERELQAVQAEFRDSSADDVA